MSRETLDQAYPPGLTRAEIVRRRGPARETRLASPDAPDPFLRAAAASVERDCLEKPASCDLYLVPRGFMGLGLYQDYVFYSAEGAVLQARRRFLD